MSQTGRQSLNTSTVLSVIMGGGQGTRLFPLTKERAKPAVPLAGKYRLVDIPISNCINSGLRRIYLLTQFNSASLHRHISQSYKFDHFSGGFVEILAAEQTYTDTSWYQGTADAVRKNKHPFQQPRLGPHPHPERRPALSHGFPRTSSSSTSRPEPMSPSPPFRCCAREAAVPGHHADRRRPAHHALRREAERAGDCWMRSGWTRHGTASSASHGRGRVVPGLDGHLRLQARGALPRCWTACRRISASTSFRALSRTCGFSRMFSRATGRTSERSARSSRRTSI